MIRKFTLEMIGSQGPKSQRQAVSQNRPIYIWISDDIGDFRAIWPISCEVDDARCYAFQCADFLEIRSRTITRARNVAPLFVVVFDRETDPLMLLPLGIERRFGVRILSFLDGGLSDYNAPIVFPGVQDWTANDIDSIWRALSCELPPFDVAHFTKMPVQICDLRNPLTLRPTTAYHEFGHAVRLPGQWKDFERRLPRRRHSRRQLRRMQELGSVSFEVATTSEEIKALLSTLIRQKTQQQLETIGSAAFDQPGYRDFVLDTTNSLSAPIPIYFSVLKCQDTIVAAHWGYVVRSRFYYLLSSYEGGEWARYSAGRLLLDHLLEWSFAHGLEVFDFGIGDETYKLEYESFLIELRRLVEPITFTGRIYVGMIRLQEMLRNTPIWQVLKSTIRVARGVIGGLRDRS